MGAHLYSCNQVKKIKKNWSQNSYEKKIGTEHVLNKNWESEKKIETQPDLIVEALI